MSVFRAWREARALRRRALTYVGRIVAEPDDADVRWLARHATAGDEDHARWELRYARRALGLLVAGRDALDDRTASVVARELTAALNSDRFIAPDKMRVVQQQFNARLQAYGEVLTHRQEGETTGARLGRALLTFAGRGSAPPSQLLAEGGELLGRYLGDANGALRDAFGTASLPEHVPPSTVRRAASSS